jgi:protein transport protein SEC61 subunit alpha
MIMTIGQATAYVLSGMYGDVSSLGITTSVLLILQLFFAGVLVLLLVFLS